MPRNVELVYFEGCPNADAARRSLRRALAEVGQAGRWTEWDLMADATPDRLRGYASPTVLVDGADVTGAGPTSRGVSCRSGPIPAPSVIVEALRG